MAALMFADVPGYAAILFRRTFADLALPQALMARAHEWLQGTDAHWNERDKTWTFPSGATLTFGYLASENDKYRYQSAEFQFIGFDELTQFTESQYTYLFSRLRRKAGVVVPLRMRSASNPGGAGHAWVFERFVVPGSGRVFVPAGLADNPHIDRAEYERSLSELDDTTRQQLLEGLWVTDPAGKPFQREWWRGQNRYDAADEALRRRVVGRWLSWDTGYKDKETNDYTANSVLELTPDWRLLVRKVEAERLTFPNLLEAIEEAATHHNRDRKLRGVLIEDKGSGISALQTLHAAAPAWLRGLLVPTNPGSASKEERATLAAVWAKRGCILLPHPGPEVPWLLDFERELYEFPHVEHDDRTDTLTQAIIYLEHYLAAGWQARLGGGGSEGER